MCKGTIFKYEFTRLLRSREYLLLVLCARQLKASERGAEAMISATPMPLPTFRLLRYGAIACAFLIAAALPVMACFLFYRLVFDYTAVGGLLGLGLLLLLPPAIFLFGAAMLLGSRRAAAVYVLLAAVLIIGVFRITPPVFIDIIGSSAVRPLNAGEYDLSVTPAFVAGRAAFAMAGIGLMIVSLCQAKKRPAR